MSPAGAFSVPSTNTDVEDFRDNEPPTPTSTVAPAPMRSAPIESKLEASIEPVSCGLTVNDSATGRRSSSGSTPRSAIAGSGVPEGAWEGSPFHR